MIKQTSKKNVCLVCFFFFVVLKSFSASFCTHGLAIAKRSWLVGVLSFPSIAVYSTFSEGMHSFHQLRKINYAASVRQHVQNSRVFNLIIENRYFEKWVKQKILTGASQYLACKIVRLFMK